MRIGASLFLIALGAILKFAVTDSFRHVDLGVVGVVLMIVGVLGLVLEAIFWSMHHRSRVVVQEPVYRDAYQDAAAPRVERY